MAKKSLFIAMSDFSPVLYELLQEKFELFCWNQSTELSKENLMENVKGKFGIVCSPRNIIDKDIIEAAGDTLKVVATHSVGLDHLDIAELKSRKVRIGYCLDVNAPYVAEYAMALLLATGRQVVAGHNTIMKGDWTYHTNTPSFLMGSGPYKSNVAVIGCGGIGLSILKKLNSFDPKNLWYFSRSKKPEAEKLGANLKSIDFIMKESDFIILALGLNNQTKEIINKSRINSMKSTAILINIGRGGLIDEDALIEALRNKKIAGAGLDVFCQEPLPVDSSFIKLDNVVLSPHLASNSYSCLSSMAELTALNVLAVLDGTKMPAEVL